MESEDYAFYQGLVYLMDNNVEHLGDDLTFSTAVISFMITCTLTRPQIYVSIHEAGKQFPELHIAVIHNSDATIYRPNDI